MAISDGMKQLINAMYANPARAEEHIAVLNRPAIMRLDAAGLATGAAPTLTFTGLRATDRVIGSEITAPGTTATAAIAAITNVAADQAVVQFSADPVGAQVRLVVERD